MDIPNFPGMLDLNQQFKKLMGTAAQKKQQFKSF